MFVETVYEPDTVAEEDAIIRPTLTSPGDLDADSDESRRLERNTRAHLLLERQIQGAGTAPSGVPPQASHNSSLPVINTMATVLDDQDNLRRQKSSYAHSGATAVSARYSSQVPGDYIRNSAGYSIDLQFRNQYGGSLTNNTTIPTATIVSSGGDSDHLDEICKETKKNSKIVKMLILLVLVLLGCAGVAAYLVMTGKFEKSEVVASVGSDLNNDTIKEIVPIPSESPVQIVIPQPSTSPSKAKSLRPSPSPSKAPTFFPTNPPTPMPTRSAGPTLVPTPAPTKACMPWCANHSADWYDPNPTVNQKCGWPLTCGGCSQCDDPNAQPTSAPTILSVPTISPPCENWCANNNTPWYDENVNALQKCRFQGTCAGCPECDDPAIFPPAGNNM